MVGWSLLVRAFTPLGAGLAFVRALEASRAGPAAVAGDRAVSGWVWGGSTLAAMALLAGKLHHEYYWLPLAPVAAVGVARAIERLAAARPRAGGDSGGVLVVLCAFQARSTWRTPAEWASLEAAGRAVAAIVPQEAWVAASEALLFQADRRGCRMEWTSDAARRAAGEWGGRPHGRKPPRSDRLLPPPGARYFADLGSRDPLSPRKGLHDAVRRRYKVIVDSPEVLIADLSDSGTHWNAN